MTHQTTRYAVICAAIDYVESHFTSEAEAKERHAELIENGRYDEEEIYVSKVTMTWDGPEATNLTTKGE